MPGETLKAVPALTRWSAQRGPEAVQAAVAAKARTPRRGWPRRAKTAPLSLETTAEAATGRVGSKAVSCLRANSLVSSLG